MEGDGRGIYSNHHVRDTSAVAGRFIESEEGWTAVDSSQRHGDEVKVAYLRASKWSWASLNRDDAPAAVSLYVFGKGSSGELRRLSSNICFGRRISRPVGELIWLPFVAARRDKLITEPSKS